jgi:2'-5' RNA ligase
VRLFFSLPLPDEVLAAAARLQRELREAARGNARLSFGDPAQLHATLAFLGEQPDPETALAAGEAALAGQRAFAAALGGVEGAPRAQRPRVLQLGFAEGAAGLDALSRRLGSELRARGIALPDRPLRPHVTLARDRTSVG